MKFEIHAAEVRLHHLNVRTEKHGSDDVTALDLRLHWETGQEALAQFHPALLKMLFAPPPANQAPVAGVEPGRPVRVFASMGPLHWSDNAEGLTLAVHHAAGNGEDLDVPDATADSFVITPLDGGSVRIAFRVRAVCRDERVLGRLPLLLKRALPMTLLREKNADKGKQRPILQAAT